MSGPRFSILIPTRERARYLEFAIRSCFAQRFSDFEIIIADNCSSEATIETVRRFQDDRIQYRRSDEPLAMSENWERGLREARGEYVTILGDDDALLLHALTEADGLLRATGTPALRWALAHYRWPDVPPELAPNLLVIPLQRGCVWEDARAVIPAVIDGKRHYADLPTLYNSFVHRDVISSLRGRGGRVFCSKTPDIYSGFAVGTEVGKYLSTLRPLGLAGVGARSNGAAVWQGKTSTVSRDYDSLNDQFGFGWHPRAPKVTRSLPAITIESFEQARDRYPSLARIKVDKRGLIARVLAERSQVQDADAMQDAVRGVEEWVQNNHQLAEWFRTSRAALTASNSGSAETFQVPPKGLHDGAVVLDASEFNAGDSFGVINLFERLVRAIDWPSSPPADRSWRDLARSVVPPIVLKGVRAMLARS